MGVRLIQISVVYFFIGTILGMLIHSTPELANVHPHFNLLGWVSLALAGGIYHMFPKAGESALGKIHFWLHVIGIPVMVIGLALDGFGIDLGPIVPIGALIVIIGTLFFMINVLKHVRK